MAEKEAKLANFLWDYCAHSGQFPTLSEMAQFMGIAPGSVDYLLRNMEKKDLVVRTGSGSRCWRPTFELNVVELRECALKEFSVERYKIQKLKDWVNSAPVIDKAPIKKGGSEMLEAEEMTLVSMCGIEPKDFIERVFGDLPTYKVFAADRAKFRAEKVYIPWVTLSNDDFASMGRFGITPIAWLQTKYSDIRAKVEGLKAVPKITEDTLRFYETHYGREAAAELKRRIEEEGKRGKQ